MNFFDIPSSALFRRGCSISYTQINRTSPCLKLSFSFKRLQFPVWLAFAITINKSQGQSLKVTGLGLDFTYECFSHGQIYVGMSRAMDPSKLYIVADENGETKTVMYAQVLHYITLMNSMKLWDAMVLSYFQDTI